MPGKTPGKKPGSSSPSSSSVPTQTVREGAPSSGSGTGSSSRPGYSKSRAERKDFPYILFVHTGGEERGTMDRETWTCFYEKLNVACMNLVFGGKEAPRVEWCGYSKGVGLIAPADKESRAIMKDIVSSIKVAEYTFRAWARGEKGEYYPLTIRLPSTMPRETYTAAKVMREAVLHNRLPDKYIIRSCQAVAGGRRDRLLRVGVEGELFDALKRLEGTIYVAESKLEVYYHGARLAPSTPT